MALFAPRRTRSPLVLLAAMLGAVPAAAQFGPPVSYKPAPLATPIPAESLPAYVRKTPPTNATIQQIWTEGMQRSQVGPLLQVLSDSIGSRLTASPDIEKGSAWLQAMYKSWGITARTEKYGTWTSWERGPTHVDLVAPRVRTLEALALAWSPGTKGKAITAPVIVLPPLKSEAEFLAWLPNARAKFVLVSAPQLSCRSSLQWQEFGTAEEQARNKAAQDSVRATWQERLAAAKELQARLDSIGARGALSTQFSSYPGTDKYFGTTNLKVTTVGVGCEDYGLLARLAERGQGPVIRVQVEGRFLGERPVWNTIAELKGTGKPDEYVMLSAHFDSWTASSGTTDNGTGTIMMMEALRILKQVYPAPKRTILVGHWSGEEQGLNGSRAFVEDHPEVVKGLQALFNQDNGTGRVVNLGPGPFSDTGPRLQQYLAEVPAELTQWIRFGRPSAPAGGGSDHAGFQCVGAPGFSFGALGWDYSLTTWHTNRDTFDKAVLEDLRSNATLAAMMAYLASEDPERMPRTRLDPLPPDRDGKPQAWPECPKSLRTSAEYKR